MSERGEVVVTLPLERPPVGNETRELLRAAFGEARQLVAGVGGLVLGIVKVASAADPTTGALALRVTFAVDAPESTWHHRKSFATS